MGTFAVRSQSNEEWIEKTKSERPRPVSMYASSHDRLLATLERKQEHAPG